MVTIADLNKNGEILTSIRTLEPVHHENDKYMGRIVFVDIFGPEGVSRELARLVDQSGSVLSFLKKDGSTFQVDETDINALTIFKSKRFHLGVDEPLE